MGIVVPFKTVSSLPIIDFRSSCPEAGLGIIVLLITMGSCFEAGMVIIMPFKTVLSLLIIY